MWRIKFISTQILVLLISVLLMGCSNSNKNYSERLEPFHIKSGILYTDLKKDATLAQNIDLVFDTSVSMRGYLYHNNSRYSKVLDGIKTTAETLTNRTKGCKISYYSFGEAFSKVSNPEALTEWNSYNNSKSHIDLAIKNANLDNLTVIVSDLAIEPNSLDKLINRLGGEYISKRYAIGILGIKSEYEGYVYDLEKENDRVVLLTNDKKPEDTYPFYLLILGNQNNISEFYKNLKYFTLEDFPNQTYNFSLFPIASKGIITSVDNKALKLNRLNDESRIFVDSDQFVDDEKAKKFKIAREPKGKIGFNLSGLRCETLKYIPKTISQITNEVEVYCCGPKRKEWLLSKDQEGLIKVKDNSKGTNLDIDMIISSSQMQKNATYAICVKTFFKQGKEDEDRAVFEVPEWAKKWTTDKSKIPIWKSEYSKFLNECGDVSGESVPDKYREWLSQKKIHSVVSINTTNDLDKLLRKISYYIEKDNDEELSRYVFYITKKY